MATQKLVSRNSNEKKPTRKIGTKIGVTKTSPTRVGGTGLSGGTIR